MEILLSIIIGIIVIGVVIVSVNYNVHISQVKDFTKKYGKANYNIFIKEFNKYNWKLDSSFRNSLFDRSTNSKIHASVIKFNDIGMIIKNPIDYVKVCYFLWKYTGKLYKEQLKEKTYKWTK